MWAVAAQPQTGLTPMIPTPNLDLGTPTADVVSRASVRGIKNRAPRTYLQLQLPQPPDNCICKYFRPGHRLSFRSDRDPNRDPKGGDLFITELADQELAVVESALPGSPSTAPLVKAS